VILLTGFGPFMDVTKNPSGELAIACQGLRVGGETIVGAVLPVSYTRAIEQTVALAESLKPRLILGTGVSRSAEESRLEGRAYADYSESLRDMDGAIGNRPSGPPQVAASLDLQRMCTALGVESSSEPGRYVCNAWLYEVSEAMKGYEVGFLHIPMTGFEPARLLEGFRSYLRGGSVT
jgi:pyroglutamyl-peptidase